MKVTNLNRLSKLIAKNTPVYLLGEHRTVGVDVGGSLGKVPCSEDLARQIHVLGVSTADQAIPSRNANQGKPTTHVNRR